MAIRAGKPEPATADKMREMRAAGMKVKDIAAELACSESVVSRCTKDLRGICKWSKGKEAYQSKPRNRESPLRVRWREIQESARRVSPAELERRRQEREKGMRPCEHCQWRMDGAKDIVCLGYCELWGTQDKKAPARSCTLDRRTAPNEAAS